jgi:hypothetical protein
MRSILKRTALHALFALLAQASQGAGVPADIPNVSLVSLIATPERFDNTIVRVQGVAYLDSKHYINAIFLTREDKIRGNTANAIFLEFSPAVHDADRLNGKFVIIEGKFTSANKGHLNAFPACLRDVTRVEAVQGRNE